jgi:hypothetical protein
LARHELHEKVSKQFFFEKKNQKTFASWRGFSGEALATSLGSALQKTRPRRQTLAKVQDACAANPPP